ncbi:MAG: hypothetical protein QOG87_2973 [Actinomycetota bacterium]
MQEPIAPLLTLAAAGLALWLVATAAVRVARRPRSPDPGPETMELRPEPPAVAGMLANDFLVTRDTLPATLIDLAARGAVEIESHGDDTYVDVRREIVDLLPHEERVLHHVQSLARDGRVPAAALTTGPQDSSRRWWTHFRKDVVGEAQRRDLCRPLWDRGIVGALWVALIGIGVVFWASVRFDFEKVDATPLFVVTLVGMVVAVASAAFIAASDRQRDTGPGRRAAAHWLGFGAHHEDNDVIPTLPASSVVVRGRYLAYCAALGLATGAVRDLPLGAEDDERAWSNYGGRWRQVRVRYPRLRPGWGRRPWVALVAGVIGTFVSWNVFRLGGGMRAVTDANYEDFVAWLHRAGTVVTGLGILLLVWFGTEAVLALSDLVSGDRRVVGRIVRCRERAGFEFNPPKDEGGQRRYVAVDTGAGDRIAAWSVSRAVYPHCVQGREVEAVVTRGLQHVRSVRPA